MINGSVLTPVIATGGSFGGTGTMGSTTVGSGATLAPGQSTAILHVAGDLTLALGATYLVELNGTAAASSYHQTTVTGTVTVDGAALSLSLDFRAVPGTAFVIIDNDGVDAVSGMFTALPEGRILAINGQSFSISYQGGSGNDVVLTAVVPEPKTWLLLVIGTCFCLARTVRSSQRASRQREVGASCRSAAGHDSHIFLRARVTAGHLAEASEGNLCRRPTFSLLLRRT